MGPGPRILVVGRRPFQTRLRAALLEVGADLGTAAGASAAKAVLRRRQRPDLLVLEVGSADGRELELLDHIRKTESLLNLFVLSMAAELDDQATLAAFDRGTDELLSMTIPDAELLARVRAMLRRIVIGRGGGQFVFQDIALDAENRRIRIGEREETLTRTEYQLLHLFIQKAGRTLPRRYLLRYLWNTDDQFRTRSIDMHVSHLRKKLLPSSCRIDTVRPLGYKLTTVR